ncbi:MAG: hypothetical protein ACON4T_02130 [Synechococcus sp.]
MHDLTPAADLLHGDEQVVYVVESKLISQEQVENVLRVLETIKGKPDPFKLMPVGSMEINSSCLPRLVAIGHEYLIFGNFGSVPRCHLALTPS